MNKIWNWIKTNKTKVIFSVLVILAIFTRFYKLDKVPHGMNVDEAGMAYDSYCIANYGTDRYLNHLPVYLVNFGGGQSALYTYLASIFVKVFGFSLYVVRMPAAILGVIVIILSYFMVKDKLGEKFALVFMALIIICPWHIMESRWGLDCNLFAPMSIISIFFLTKAKTTNGYIIAGICFGLTLYTYVISYMILPIFLAMTIIYMLYTKKIKFINIVIMGIPIFILAIPLILMILVNNGYIREIKGFISIPELWIYRGTEISLSNIKANLVFIKTMFTNDHLVYNAFPEYGTIYKFAPFLSIFGFFVEINNLFINIKNRKFKVNSLILFLFISAISCALVITEPNINRANAIFIPLLFFVAVTIKHIYKNYKIFFAIIICLYFISFASFINFYFNKYETKYMYQPLFERDIFKAMDYINNNNEFQNREIHINTTSDEPYIYTLIANPISPYEFSETLCREGRNIVSYGKYYFNNKEIKDEAIYCIRNDDAFIDELVGYGFNIKNINTYTIAYK